MSADGETVLRTTDRVQVVAKVAELGGSDIRAEHMVSMAEKQEYATWPNGGIGVVKLKDDEAYEVQTFTPWGQS